MTQEASHVKIQHKWTSVNLLKAGTRTQRKIKLFLPTGKTSNALNTVIEDAIQYFKNKFQLTEWYIMSPKVLLLFTRS